MLYATSNQHNANYRVFVTKYPDWQIYFLLLTQIFEQGRKCLDLHDLLRWLLIGNLDCLLTCCNDLN